ncbi:MAG: hypothetical protein D6710_03240 [Nitrospirae bacterium]|nr:MAG: hypothetical protein D6710_03240 [Nitrospirota bacterium]
MAIFALFSMLSKETGFMLVLLLPAFYYFLNRKTPLTFHLTVIGFFVIIVSALLSLGNRIYIVENSYLQTIIKGLKLGGLFLYKIFNWSLITPYSACLLEGIGNLAVALTLITLTGLIILIAAGYKRKSPLSFFALWIIITVVPGLYVSLSKNYRLPGSDRFLYSVMPAVAFLLVFFLFKYLKKASIAAVSVLIVLSAYSSHKQSSIWHDNYSLWRAASVQCKNQWTYPLLGYALSALEKNPSEAEMLLQKIINGTDSGRLKTLYPAESSLYRLNAIVRLGTFYEKRKKLKGANQLFERALKEFDKLLADYPRITRWELGGINYLIGYHYYLRAVREQRMDYIKTALKQADYAIKYRPTDIKPYQLKTDILLGIKDCKNAYREIATMYKLFGRTKAVLNTISKFKKICTYSSESLEPHH